MPFFNARWRSALLLGVGISAGLLLFALIQIFYGRHVLLESTFGKIIQENEIVSQMRIDLLKSVEMEKNAVMAVTDDESRNFAGQSLAASAAVEKNLELLNSLIKAAPRQTEQKLIADFSDCWTEFRRLDQEILDLAVQNTNLKAASLSREKGSETIERIENILKNVMSAYAGSGKDSRVTRLSYRIINTALKIQILHSAHIAESSDLKMDQLEAKIKSEESEAAKCLHELDEIVDQQNRNGLLQAKDAFSEFNRVTAAVVQLSRQNSNIKSLELSLSKKRKATIICDEILAAFQESVQKRSFPATK